MDGWVLPKAPFAVWEAGQEHRAGLLLGTNARELSRPFFPVAGLKEGIAAGFGLLAPHAFQIYGVNNEQQSAPDPVYGDVMAQRATDSQFRFGTIAELIWHFSGG